MALSECSRIRGIELKVTSANATGRLVCITATLRAVYLELVPEMLIRNFVVEHNFR